MSININIPLVALAALMALIPFDSSAQAGGCTLNGVPVPGDPTLIEGTRKRDIIDCSNSPYRHDIYGYGGADILIGSDYDDFIAGGGGNDIIYGGPGNDAIDGGAKDDELWGGPGDDIIFGGVGASPASGVGCELQPLPPEEEAAAGRIYLAKGGSGDDYIDGGSGDDCINAGSGEDEVYGGDGNDTIYGGNHADYLNGEDGTDHIDGGWHSDTCVNGEILSGCEDEYEET